MSRVPERRPKTDSGWASNRHHVNSAPIHLILNAQDWLPIEAKVRLLEWKIRLDLVQYAARRCPSLRFEEAAAYEPRDTTNLVAKNFGMCS
jgi:questin oxidase-like protein